MYMITKHIPNAITSLNLLSGSLAIIFAFSGNFTAFVICIVLSAIFDFCDGLAARLLKAYSPMGKELDSLADLVSFGLAPAIMGYNLLNVLLPADYRWLAYAMMLIPVFAALRLAKFNIDDSQTTTFRGLPVPANALWWIGACQLLIDNAGNDLILWLFVATIPLFAYMMVSNHVMFSLKFSNLGWRGNEVRYILILLSVVLLIVQGIAGCAAIIGAYILLSIFSDTIRQYVSK